MIEDNISEIRILPSDKSTFPTETKFKQFVTKTMIGRDGKYYFPNKMMKCKNNALVLFQYNGKIRAVGILIDSNKIEVYDECGIKYAGYYKFDINTLTYLNKPIDKDILKK